jgi:hypothetical protein
MAAHFRRDGPMFVKGKAGEAGRCATLDEHRNGDVSMLGRAA